MSTRRAELYATLARAAAEQARAFAELAELEGGAEVATEPANDAAPPAPASRTKRTGRRGPRFPSAAKIEALRISELDMKAAEKAAQTTGMLPAARKR